MNADGHNDSYLPGKTHGEESLVPKLLNGVSIII